MKKLLLGIAMMAAGVVTAQAQAHVAAPVWGCRLSASHIKTASQLELLLVRGETATAHGYVVCQDAVGQRVGQHVEVSITSGGVGPAFNGSLEGLKLYAVVAGLSTPKSMIGTYQLAAGPRLGLIAARAGLMAGAQVSGHGIGAEIEAVFENRFSIGVDFGGMTMTVRPVKVSRH